MLMLVVACSTHKQIVEVPVPVETVKTEYIHDTRIDSVFVKDSIDRWVNGDTVFIYKEHTKYKYLAKTDTLVRVDSIPKIIKVETVKEVEVNHINWWQESLMWLGGGLLLFIIMIVIRKFK